MKMQDAIDKIHNKPKGFMVSFDWCGDGFLRNDHFPDKHAGEKLIPTEHEAWELATRFAAATKGETCNLYVTKHDFTPVENHNGRKIENR